MVTTMRSPNLTNPPFSQSQEDVRIAVMIQTYLSPVLVILGTVGNTLSFLVLMRKRMRNASIYNFLAVLAIIDTSILWISCFMTWISKVTSFKLVHYSDFTCKFVNYVWLALTYTASWIIVLMTLERLIAILYPLRIKTMWTLGRSRAMIAAVILLVFAFSSYILWTFKHQYNNKGTLFCTFDHDNMVLRKGFKYINFLGYCAVPFVIVLTSNISIIYKVKKAPTILKNSSTSTLSDSPVIQQPQQRVTILLLTVTFTWFILMLPYSILSIVKTMHNIRTARVLCFMLVYINHSINFLLYCITGQRFREELKVMFRCKKRRDTRAYPVGSTMRFNPSAEAVPLSKPPQCADCPLRPNGSSGALIQHKSWPICRNGDPIEDFENR